MSDQQKYVKLTQEDQKKYYGQVSDQMLRNVEYDDDTIPPNWAFAKEHRIATQVAYPQNQTQYYNYVEGNRCKCCNQRLDYGQIPLSCNIIDLKFLGSGYPQFFTFIKHCIYILIIIMLLSCTYNLITNYDGSDCEEGQSNCAINIFTKLSLANKRNNGRQMIWQQIFNLITITAIIIALQFCRYSLKKVGIECDEKLISPADFSIQVSNIKKMDFASSFDGNILEIIKQKFQGLRLSNGEMPKVQLIQMNYDCQEFTDLTKEKEMINQKRKKTIKKQQLNQASNLQRSSHLNQHLSNIVDRLNLIDKQIAEIETKIRLGDTDLFAGSVFVVFETQYQRDQVLSLCGLTWTTWLKLQLQVWFGIDYQIQNLMTFNGSILCIKQAPEPQDIIWENTGHPTKRLFIRRFFTTIVKTVVLIICIYCILLLNSIQANYKSDKSIEGIAFYKTISSYLSFSVSIMTIVLSSLYSILNSYLCSFDKYDTQTLFGYHVSINNIFANFFMFAFALTFNYVYFQFNIMGEGGLIYTVSVLYFTNCFMRIFLEYFNITYFYKNYKRKVESLKGDRSLLLQIQAQKLYEDPAYEIQYKYPIVVYSIFFAAFYSTIVPIGVFVIIVQLIGFYWVTKQIGLGTTLSTNMMETIEYIVIIFSLSNIFFINCLAGDAPVTKAIQIFPIIGVIIGILNAVLPMDKINDVIFKVQKARPTEITYQQAMKNQLFNLNYENANPIAQSQLRNKRDMIMTMKSQI